jgi:dipeptidyl aminopeptidase/acylaminoacyl peptidase
MTSQVRARTKGSRQTRLNSNGRPFAALLAATIRLGLICNLFPVHDDAVRAQTVQGSPENGLGSPSSVEVQGRDNELLRPMAQEDLLRLETFGDNRFFPSFSISPDGQLVTFVVLRARAAQPSGAAGYRFWDGMERAEIWMVPAQGGTVRRLTDGGKDGSAFFYPVWSPDGKRLAMLSNRGANLRVWVWDRNSGQLRPLSDRGVDFLSGPMAWLSSTELACAVLGVGEKAADFVDTMRSVEIAEREWTKARAGLEATASVLESGAQSSLPAGREGELELINVVTGKIEVIADGRIKSVAASLTGRRVAFLQRVAASGIGRGPAASYYEGIYRLCARTANGKVSSTEIGAMGYDLWPLKWSPDGRTLGVKVVGSPEGHLVPQVRLFRVEDDKLIALDLPKLAGGVVDDVAWTGAGQMLLHQRWDVNLGPSGSKGAWNIEDRGSPWRELTSGMKEIPAELMSEAHKDTAIGLAGGKLWRIGGDLVFDLTEKLDANVTSIVWPTRKGYEDQRPVSELIFTATHNGASDLYHIDLQSGQIVALVRPAPGAEAVAYSPNGQRVIFVDDSRRGSNLWSKRVDGLSEEMLYETNEFLEGIAEGHLREIKYHSEDGEELNAWVVLPIRYMEGKSYPTITWVYPQHFFDSDIPPHFANMQINNASYLNVQMLAARGYLVLLPDFPRRVTDPVKGAYRAPMVDLTKGVMPAIDKAIGLGLTDPDRVGLIGQSGGGYEVYGLVAQSNRFKAAVALAGFSDLVAANGQLEAPLRYSDRPHEEDHHFQREAPGLEYDVRNSPIFYLDRVLTPILIIQGDMDYIGMEQGEEFFTGLYRQGKRAEFVRYWGEGHVIESPANIRDMWERIYTWFDEFLKPAANPSRSTVLSGGTP